MQCAFPPSFLRTLQCSWQQFVGLGSGGVKSFENFGWDIDRDRPQKTHLRREKKGVGFWDSGGGDRPVSFF